MTDKTKKIIAREGLIIVGFIVCFAVGMITLSSIGGGLLMFSIIGYPIYLVIRFIIWAIKTLSPQGFIPWGKINPLIDNQRYREALELIEEFEKNNTRFMETYKEKDAWESIKNTCFKGMFMIEYYAKSSKLYDEKKYEEAKKVADKGYKLMLAFAPSLGITKEMLENLNKEIENRFADTTNLKMGDITNFRKEYFSNNSSIPKDSMLQELFDLMITPSLCDVASINDKELKENK